MRQNHLNNGSFVVDLGKGGWAYIKYIDQITILESDTSVSIVDGSVASVENEFGMCYKEVKN